MVCQRPKLKNSQCLFLFVRIIFCILCAMFLFTFAAGLAFLLSCDIHSNLRIMRSRPPRRWSKFLFCSSQGFEKSKEELFFFFLHPQLACVRGLLPTETTLLEAIIIKYSNVLSVMTLRPANPFCSHHSLNFNKST